MFLLTGEKTEFRVRKLFGAPFFVAIVVGLFLFLTQLALPDILIESLRHIANLNTPLAMFTIGIYLAEVNGKQMLKNQALYKIAAVRLAVIPVVALAVLSLLPGGYGELKTAVLIAAACPVGSNVAVYAQLHHKDYPYAVETVVVSTAFSVITVPFVLWVSEMLWRM